MGEPRPIDGKSIGALYDQQATAYTEFADERYAWQYLEKPAFDRYISDLYTPETRVLDIGCGTGVVARHLVSRGVLPQNIIGIDTSSKLLEHARTQTPGVTFLECAADDFVLPKGSINLVITNTVLHHLDNETLERMLDKIYDALSPDGTYFFVEINPDHNAEGRDPRNTNQWTTVTTPWGTKVPFFNRDPSDLFDMFDRHGFDKVSGWLLNVAPEGIADPENYAYYSSRPSRMATRWRKAPDVDKILRVNDVFIPNLLETEEQRLQRELVEQYFEAWRTQSLALATEIFSPDAVSDEKPGKEEPLEGIEAIQEYWKINPLSQQNIQVDSSVVGFSDENSLWTLFNENFDVRGQHVGINGVIQFTIDTETRKIQRLTKYFTSEKSPLSQNTQS